jgi:hypothetical protein
VDSPSTIIFTILGLLVGLLATAGYGLMSVAQYRGARIAFSGTALFFAAIGLELGLVMTWPLPAKIIVAGCFGFAAAGALVYAFHSVSLLQKPAIKAQEPPSAAKPPAPYIIADCFEPQYPTEMPLNGSVFVILKSADGSFIQPATLAGNPGGQISRPANSLSPIRTAYRCDLSAKGDTPLFNVFMTFKLNIDESFIEMTGSGFQAKSGKRLGTRELTVNVRKLDIYPTLYTIYILNHSNYFIPIDPPFLARSVSSLRTNEGYDIEVKPTNTIQISLVPMVEKPEK